MANKNFKLKTTFSMDHYIPSPEGYNIEKYKERAAKRKFPINTFVRFKEAKELSGLYGVVVGYADEYRPIVLLTPPVEHMDLAIGIPYTCLEVVK